MSDPARAAEVRWTVAGTVLTVTSTLDRPATASNCPGPNCRLRDAIAKVNSGIAGPVLTTFAPTLSEVQLTENAELLIQAAAQDLVIDGTDAEGNPNPLEQFHNRFSRAQIHQNPNDKTLAHASTLRVRAEGVELIGLQLRRSLGTPASQDLDVLAFSSPSSNGRVRTCRLDGGAQAQPTAGPGPAQGKDCIDTANTGASGFGDAVVVEDSELRYCWDRGLKSSQGYAVIRDSWVHNNLRGGLFALNPGPSNLKTERNLIEHNGWNCPNGALLPADCDRTLVRAEALQAAADGAADAGAPFNYLEMRGDVVRDGGNNGIEIMQYASGTITDVFSCGMILSNLDATTDAGKPGRTIVVRGTATSLSQRGTFLFQSGSSKPDIDLGIGTAGGNAFVANSIKNLFNGSGNLLLTAMGNQWQLCGNGSVCNEAAIEDAMLVDTNGSVEVSTAEPHRNPPAFRIDDVGGVYPTAVSRVNAVVRITGSGFNAIEGYTNPGGPGGTTSCTTLTAGNTCSPNVRGTCVEFFDHATNSWLPASGILGVTPTHLVVESPLACTRPTTIRVKRLTSTGAVDFRPLGAVGAEPPPAGTYNFCKN